MKRSKVIKTQVVSEILHYSPVNALQFQNFTKVSAINYLICNSYLIGTTHAQSASTSAVEALYATYHLSC